MSEQKQRHEVQGIVCRLQKQDCFEAQIWKEVQKISAALKVPVSTVSSINGRNLDSTGLFLELDTGQSEYLR